MPRNVLATAVAFNSLFLSASAQIAPAIPFSTGFNSSFALSDDWIAAANLSEQAAQSINAVINFDRSSLAYGGPRQDDFYTVPELSEPAIKSLKPGQVLKVQEVTDPAQFAISPGSSLSRIIYVSLSINGTLVPASAYVLWPYVPRHFGEDEGAPTILWTHGTSGFFADGAPSAHRTLWYENMMPLSLAQAGYAIVAPDYAGIGVTQSWDGTEIPHQYLASPAGGQDALFALHAAREAFGSRLSEKFAILGHSQGGGVAWSASELLASPPNATTTHNVSTKCVYDSLAKTHVGTISFAPSTRTLNSSAFAGILVGLNLESIFPDFTLDTWLTPLAIKRLELLREIQGAASIAQQLLLGEPVEAVVKPDWHEASYHAQAFERIADVGYKQVAGPLLVVQGGNDFFIPKSITDGVVAQLCADRPETSLEYLVATDFGHTPLLAGLRHVWMDWLQARFEGKAAASGCSATTLSGWLGDGAHFLGSNSFAQWAGLPEYVYQNPGAI